VCTLQTVAHTRKRKVVKFSFNGMPKEFMPSQPRAHRLRVPDAGEKRMWSRLVAYGQAHGSCCRLALAQGWLAGSDHIRSLIIVVVTCSLLPRQNPSERACALLCDGVPKGGSGVLTTLALALAAVPVVARCTAGERVSESHGSCGIVALLPTTGALMRARADSSKVLTLQLGSRARITYCCVGTGCEGRSAGRARGRQSSKLGAPPRPRDRTASWARQGKVRHCSICTQARRPWQHGSSQQQWDHSPRYGLV
jgi:hypothetical protein